MKRHLALTVAGAAAIFVTAASGAVAANVGILNVGSQKPVGTLDAASVTELATQPTVRPATQPAPDSTVPAASGAPSVEGTPSTTARPSPSTGPAFGPAPAAEPAPAVTTSTTHQTDDTTSTTTHHEDNEGEDHGDDDD